MMGRRKATASARWLVQYLPWLGICCCTGWVQAGDLGAAAGQPDTDTIASYRITVPADLRSVTVEVSTPASLTLRADSGDADRMLELQSCQGAPLQPSRGRLITDRDNGCLRYRFPLTHFSGRRSPPVVDGVVVSAPDQWLWLPELDDDSSVAVELLLPPSVSASVPWQPLAPGHYQLTRTPGSSTGLTIFGAFERVDVPVGGTHARVALVDAPGLALDPGRTIAWLRTSLDDVARVGGAYPNPNPQVIVQPVTTDRSRSPVPFGYVIRDGGETVRFFVDPRRSLADLERDWTATHEFSHLLLPYVRSREKWVSEGFASYYQNVLLARRGAYSEVEVWNRLHRSFSRAADISDPPRMDRMHQRSFWEVRMLVYWAGAALALQADARLREISDGAASLDTVLGRLAACCLPSGDVWEAEALFTKLDTFSPEPVFMPLYETLMRRPGMPDLAPLYRDLGLERDGRELRLTDDGRLSGVRRAIMQPLADDIGRMHAELRSPGREPLL